MVLAIRCYIDSRLKACLPLRDACALTAAPGWAATCTPTPGHRAQDHHRLHRRRPGRAYREGAASAATHFCGARLGQTQRSTSRRRRVARSNASCSKRRSSACTGSLVRPLQHQSWTIFCAFPALCRPPARPAQHDLRCANADRVWIGRCLCPIHVSSGTNGDWCQFFKDDGDQGWPIAGAANASSSVVWSGTVTGNGC